MAIFRFFQNDARPPFVFIVRVFIPRTKSIYLVVFIAEQTWLESMQQFRKY